jgi:hypothetical protein
MADSEPKWVLKRLMMMLEKDLKARAERHVARDIGHVSPTTQSFAQDDVDKIEPNSSSGS